MDKTSFKFLFFSLLLTLSITNLYSQSDVYSVSSGELLFQWADISLTEAAAADPNFELVGNPLRFTSFFHVGQYLHINFNNNIGVYSGMALRNVGFISDERINLKMDGNTANLQDFKIIRRSYNVGIPLALKLGSFKNHTFIFAGGELELAFLYKEKYWNSHNRDGKKYKTTQWFGAQTQNFIPSAIAGIQFPGGVNAKFKYYLKNFIDNTYRDPNNIVSDLTRYETTQVIYLSLSYQFKTSNIVKTMKPEDKFSSL